MANLPEFSAHPSYFWSCLTLQEDCPFYTAKDPTLCYFGFGLGGLYLIFMIMILIDMNAYWSLDKVQEKLDFYVNLVRKKVQLVQKDQQRLMSTQERTQKQLQRSRQCSRVLTALRCALMNNEATQFADLRSIAEQAMSRQLSPMQRGTWGINKNETPNTLM